jgi:hypothetical protein
MSIKSVEGANIQASQTPAEDSKSKVTANWPWTTMFMPKGDEGLVKKIAMYAIGFLWAIPASIVEGLFKAVNWIISAPQDIEDTNKTINNDLQKPDRIPSKIYHFVTGNVKGHPYYSAIGAVAVFIAIWKWWL